MRLEELYMKLPQKPDVHISDFLDTFQPIHPVASGSNKETNNVNTEGLSMENVFDND
jgi:hypothetical protein